MSRACPTVRVASDNEQGYVVMNESDFNPDVHTLFEEAPVAAPEPPVKPVVTKFSKAK